MDKFLIDAILGAFNFFAGLLPWWAPWVFYGILAIIALWVLNMIKNVFGWPGVWVATLVVTAVVSGLFGFRKGTEWAKSRLPAAKDKLADRRKTRTIFGPRG